MFSIEFDDSRQFRTCQSAFLMRFNGKYRFFQRYSPRFSLFGGVSIEFAGSGIWSSLQRVSDGKNDF